jgi:hypothetical protein
MDLSPAQAKMKAKADALAAEQAQRRQANQVYQAKQAAQRGLASDALAAEQAQRRDANAVYQAQQAQIRQQELGQLVAQQAAVRAQPTVDNRVLYGGNLTPVPIEQRQAQINAAQGRPTSYFGSALNTPQGPVRPAQMGRPQQSAPQRAPQQRTGGPGMGPVRPQQQFAPQPRPQQQRPEPSFIQQAMSYAKPVSAGISALGSLFSFF